MLCDPCVAPGVVVAPLIRVHMEGAIVDRLDGEVFLKVDAFVTGVGVAVFEVGEVGGGGRQPAFVAEGDEMFGVEGFDVGGCVRGPIGDYASITARAARFVAQLPAEDCGGLLVAIDDEFDVVLVGRLGSHVGEEALVGATVDVGVGVDTTKVVVVVEEGKDKLDALFLGSGDGVVETGDAVVGIVVPVLAGGIEGLVEDVGSCARVIDCPEAPDSGHFVAGLEKTSRARPEL